MLYIMYQKGTILEFIGSVVYAYDIFVIYEDLYIQMSNYTIHNHKIWFLGSNITLISFLMWKLMQLSVPTKCDAPTAVFSVCLHCHPLS